MQRDTTSGRESMVQACIHWMEVVELMRVFSNLTTKLWHSTYVSRDSLR